MRLRAVAKKLIPKSVVRTVRAVGARVDRQLIKVFAATRWTASLYYVLFSRSFGREHQGVLQGRIAYWRSVQAMQQSCVLLRRNTHRLEKGLIMQPRRASFAEGYIEETVDCYLSAQRQGTLREDEMRWAGDVLEHYFTVVSDTPVIARAREQFAKATPVDGNTSIKSVPYPHKELPATEITTEQLHTLFKRRRSTRWFQARPIADELIHQAVTMASLAPSACNRQPYECYVINDTKRAAKVAGFAGGTVGFAENIPALIVIVGDLNAYPAERDRHCIYIDSGLAAMQLMLAFETLGLSTCPINWPDVEHREVKMQKELGLKVHQRPVMLMAVGYADPEGGIPFSAKKPAEVLIKEGKQGEQDNR
jgi:nitroreductase